MENESMNITKNVMVFMQKAKVETKETNTEKTLA